MAYTTNQALATLRGYLDVNENEIEIIDNTKNRGYVLTLSSGEKVVIFVYPLVHKQDNTKNYFDTRDSGALERSITWKYALLHKLKYFCLGVNDTVDKYSNYIFSLECSEEVIEKLSGTKNGVRNGPGNQIIIPNDYIPSKDFERIVNRLGIYIAAINKNRLMNYLETYDNRPYMDLNSAQFDITITDDNEYKKAAEYLLGYISETGFEFPISKERIEKTSNEFVEKYSTDRLAALSDEEILNNIFYTNGDNTDSLCYWIEMNKECRELFGSISGGSAYKFGLFQKKDTGAWMTGSPQKPVELSLEEAVKRGKEIRDALVKAVSIIREAELHNLKDYEKLDDDLNEAIGEQFAGWGWFHKYCAIICSDKLSCYHSTDWQNHILRCFGIEPSSKYYARSGQIAMIENYAGLYYSEFFNATYDRFGSIKNFVRIGTSDEGKSYVSEWSKRGVIGIGWKNLGSLTEYAAGDGLDRNSISTKLEEMYYPNDNRTAARKAGEISRFYSTDENTIFVAMAGEKLIAFVDDIGAYFYDSNTPMAHMKTGKWHFYFNENDSLPTKTEGKLTTCYSVSDSENIRFLYDKYYYGTENNQDEEDIADPEERNKRLFRRWMNLQVKPEGDSDAGEPYSKDSINAYVSNISNTSLSDDSDKSLFFTDDVIVVKDRIIVLEKTEKKNNTQKSAVKKYLQYLIALKGDCIPLIYNTNIETSYERNRIIFGAPGTGKSYELKKDCMNYLKDKSGTYERVTFHPDYTYSQFVGAYKPVTDDDGKIRYDFVPGPFMRVYVDALKTGRTDNPQPHILIIEEINRAKVAAVFGDVFQLLDRDDDGVSEYEIQATEDVKKYLSKELGGKPDNYQRIRIPNNMFIWATMNSADQGVFPMDTAFKRRWNFEYLGINQNDDQIKGSILLGSELTQNIEWNILRRAINEKLATEYKVNEDKLMGPFFLSKKVIKTISDADSTIEDAERFLNAFKSKVIMYLYEDAAKQYKHKLFAGCDDTTKYSSVCKEFDRIGMLIFGEDFEERYYLPQKGL